MSTITQIEDLIKSSSNDLEALQGILDGVKDSMEDLKKEYQDGKKDVNEYNAAMLKLQRVYDQVIDAQKNLQKEQKKSEEALEKQHKKFKDVETSARRYGATLNTALSTISSLISETNPALATALGSVQKLIPNLVDCFGQFQKLTKSAKTAGIQMTNFGKIMKVATSPSGILLMVTALVELISYIKKAGKSTVDFTAITVDAYKSVSSMIVALDLCAESYKKMQTEAEKREFLETWKKQIDDTGLAINTINDADEVFINNTDAYIQSLLARAKAQAAENATIKTYEEYFDRTLKARDKAQKKAAQSIAIDVGGSVGIKQVAGKNSPGSWFFNALTSLLVSGKASFSDKKNVENFTKKDFEAVQSVFEEVTESELESAKKSLDLNLDFYSTQATEAWEEYYKSLEGLSVKPKGNGTTGGGKGPEIDWESFHRMLAETSEQMMWEIDNQVDLLDSESERAARELLQKKKEEFQEFWDDYVENAKKTIDLSKLNLAADESEVDELDPYADVLLPKVTDAEQAIYDARLENYSNFLSSYADLTDSISGMISDNLDAELEAGKISEAEYKRRTKVLKAFQISSIVANTASGIVDVWKAYATERIGNAEAAVATGPAAPATLAALNAKSLTSAILQTATLSAAGVAGIASVRSGNLSGVSVTPSAGISSTPTITYTQNQNSNQDVVDAINNNTIQSMQQQVVLVVDDLNKVQSNATKVSVQSSF